MTPTTEKEKIPKKHIQRLEEIHIFVEDVFTRLQSKEFNELELDARIAKAATYRRMWDQLSANL